MKIDIKTMLLTFGLCILFAFTAGDILTIKPAMPKSVVSVRCYYSYEVSDNILKYTKQGYILKNTVVFGGYCILVMEKY